MTDKEELCSGVEKRIPSLLDMELAIVKYINPRANMVVPNVCWGLHLHECDLFVLTKSGYGWEIEIKRSRADLLKDFEKKHHHESDKIKYLYYAMPSKLLPHIDRIPDYAGVIEVYWREWCDSYYRNHIINREWRCRSIREARSKSDYRFSDGERLKLYRLAALRIWPLKKKLNATAEKIRSSAEVSHTH